MSVLTLHAVVLQGVFSPVSRNSPNSVAGIPVTQAEIIAAAETRYKIPAPELQLTTVPIDFPGLRQVEFDDSVQEELGEVIGPTSAPHVARVQSVDLATFVRRLKIPQGVALTVLLRVEVTEEGWADSVDVIRTSGNEAADAAAIEYAQELRWVPGTIARSPEKQRVVFSVTLARSLADSTV